MGGWSAQRGARETACRGASSLLCASEGSEGGQGWRAVFSVSAPWLFTPPVFLCLTWALLSSGETVGLWKFALTSLMWRGCSQPAGWGPAVS